MLTPALNRPPPDGDDTHFGHPPADTDPCRARTGVPAPSQYRGRIAAASGARLRPTFLTRTLGPELVTGEGDGGPRGGMVLGKPGPAGLAAVRRREAGSGGTGPAPGI